MSSAEDEEEEKKRKKREKKKRKKEKEKRRLEAERKRQEALEDEEEEEEEGEEEEEEEEEGGGSWAVKFASSQVRRACFAFWKSMSPILRLFLSGGTFTKLKSTASVFPFFSTTARITSPPLSPSLAKARRK